MVQNISIFFPFLFPSLHCAVRHLLLEGRFATVATQFSHIFHTFAPPRAVMEKRLLKAITNFWKLLECKTCNYAAILYVRPEKLGPLDCTEDDTRHSPQCTAAKVPAWQRAGLTEMTRGCLDSKLSALIHSTWHRGAADSSRQSERRHIKTPQRGGGVSDKRTRSVGDGDGRTDENGKTGKRAFSLRLCQTASVRPEVSAS